jgi:hypothetical protein
MLRVSFLRGVFAGKTGNIRIVTHLEKCGLLSGVPLQLVHVEFAGSAGRPHRFVFTLGAAFGFVALFLLARVFFLAFGETRSSSSWHPNLQSSMFCQPDFASWRCPYF